MKKLLVTGGAGFIGSEFVRLGVERGYRLIVTDKLSYAGDMERLKGVEKQISFSRTDITDKVAVNLIFKTGRPDAVVHLAAESHVDRSISNASPFIDTNVKGTQVLLDVSKQYGIEKFINVSTDEVYGELLSDGCFSEASPLNPSSPYSVSKASADMLGNAYHRTYGLPVITIRPSNTYGPWQYPEKLIPVIIWKALNNEKIPVYGTGQNIREWLYVSDCAGGILQLLEQGEPGDFFNLGSGEEKRNLDVVKIILKILGKSEDLIEFTADRLGHDFRYALNSDKIRERIGWERRMSFNEGIENTVKWYVDNMDWMERKIASLKKCLGAV